MMRSAVGGWVLTLTISGLFAGAAVPIAATGAFPQSGADTVTVAEIMEGEDFVGTSPSRPRWSPDGRTLYFVWRRPDEESEGLYRVDREGGEPERLLEEEARRIEPRLHAVLSEDRRRAAYADEGRLYLLDVRSGRERRLLSVPAAISHVQITRDGGAVYLVVRDNLYRVEAENGAVAQLTDVRHGPKPKDEEPDSHRKFLDEQQRELFRVFETDSLRRSRAWPRPPDTTLVDTPKAFYVGEHERIQGFWAAPDGRHMAFGLVEEPTEARQAWVADYVTRDGYTERAPRERTKVGDAQPASRLGIMDLVTGDVTWVDPGLGDRPVDLLFREWSEDGRRLVAIAIARDYHDRWIMRVDAATGVATTLDTLHDDAWIGGPAWDEAGWMPDGRHVWFISETSGFAHLYVVAAGGGEASALTSGPWEVIDARLGPDRKVWYLVTSEASPHERGFYRMPLSGGDRRLVTTAGTLQGDQGREIGDALAMSPDGERLAALYGWPNHPPELFLREDDPGAPARQITESTTSAFRAHDWMSPDIVYVPAGDGTEVPARLYRPEEPSGAGVIFVHGAGYLQNVHRWWSSYYREYMFHNLLAKRGYTVLDMDYRGSAGYGRDWRIAIRQHMGGTDLTDQEDGARFLADSLGVDPGRIGIYGGSYGGFITLMAMFRAPGTFAAGAALRPVTDWAHYNHWYTSRILGLPQDDPEAYRRSSPIYFADGLQGALLICHGVIDQNVHFQDTVRLAERLMELGKRNWNVAIYPKEDHGFVHPWSWTDEYTRILNLFETNLRSP